VSQALCTYVISSPVPPRWVIRWHRDRDGPLLEWRFRTHRLESGPLPPEHPWNLPEPIQTSGGDHLHLDHAETATW